MPRKRNGILSICIRVQILIDRFKLEEKTPRYASAADLSIYRLSKLSNKENTKQYKLQVVIVCILKSG